MSLNPTASSRRDPAADESAIRRAASKNEAAVDAELVRRYNAGDETAFSGIMRRHEGKIFAVVLGLLHNHADAEEITQDTFLRAYRGLGRFRGDSSLATWLHRIAVNLARNRYWYFFRRRRHDTLSLDCPLGDDRKATFTELVASETPDPSRAAATDEFSALISSCMKKLDACHRDILTLHNIRHRSYGEIARALHLKVGTVKSRIARARANLRLLLVEMCPEFAPGSGPAVWFEPARSSGHIAAA